MELCGTIRGEAGTNIYTPQTGNWQQTKVWVPPKSDLVEQWVLLGFITEEGVSQRELHHQRPPHHGWHLTKAGNLGPTSRLKGVFSPLSWSEPLPVSSAVHSSPSVRHCQVQWCILPFVRQCPIQPCISLPGLLLFTQATTQWWHYHCLHRETQLQISVRHFYTICLHILCCLDVSWSVAQAGPRFVSIAQSLSCLSP